MRRFPVVLLLVIGGIHGAVTAQSLPVQWEPVGSLRTSRQEHTATLLTSGRILVAGGWGSAPLSSAELYDPRTGSWEPTGSLTTARHQHSATLLPSGKVLAVGGNFSSASAELYDPRTGTWERTARPLRPRTVHTATLLPSGRVLVVSGGSAELYDPSTETWTLTGSLLTSRTRHTATLLPSGQVLVVGGVHQTPTTGPDDLTSAELYDESTGVWTSTGSLAAARRDHTATLLPSGKVLVAGGRSGLTSEVILASLELYDPGTGTWEDAGGLARSRYGHSATLLVSGEVLFAGGFTSFAQTVAIVELYDPATGTLTNTGSLATGRYEHTTTLLPFGKVLVVGGTSFIDPLASVESYDPSAGSWRDAGFLSSFRYKHTATLLPSGEVLVAGGEGLSPLASAELYAPATGTWRNTGSLAGARNLHTATLLTSGQVLVAGGVPEFGSPITLATAELYDPGTGTWEGADSLAAERASHTATLLPSGQVLVAGGYDGQYLASAELYDPATGTWTGTGALATARSEHTATLLPAGQVLVSGGVQGFSSLSNAELYEPRTGTWQSTGSMITPRHEHTATLLPSGKVLVVGGANADADALASAELYDPVTGRWERTAPLAVARTQHTATLLRSGRVVVAGGSDALSLSSVEIFDPSTETWQSTDSLATARAQHTATLLASGEILAAGGRNAVIFELAEIYRVAGAGPREPIIDSASARLRYGQPFVVSGRRFRGDSETDGGTSWSSAANYPLIQLRDLASGQSSWLPFDPRTDFWDDPMTLTVGELPPTLNPGPQLLTVVAAGVPGESVIVELECSVAITGQPADQTADLGASATFSVAAQGARRYQWRRDGADIPGATAATYVTPPIVAADAGTAYTVVVDSGCARAVSAAATLHVTDETFPTAEVLHPSGGEYWVLSDPEPNVELVTWEMSDDVRICRVGVELLFSGDGGASYQPVPAGGGLPAGFGPGGTCGHAERVEATSVAYTVPATPPSGAAGSLYKVRVEVTDQAGNATTALSAHPFFIVRPNPDSVRTLILANLPRMRQAMGVTGVQAAELATNLQDLAHHPRVLGLVVDLAGVTDLAGLYAAWDADPGNPDRANQVLFGCHPPLPAGCAAAKNGLHDLLRDLLDAYGGVESIVLVGDDRIVPMARVQDRTVLLPEESYPAGGDLTPGGTTVGRALAANKYLSDDPLAVLDAVRPDELGGSLFLPDVAVGRLVETPAEIVGTIATFISQDGVLDLAARGHRVQVTGYDFLRDSAATIRRRWTSAVGAAAVDGVLIGQTWNDGDLLAHLCGNGGGAYGLVSLNGHAVHHAEGVPGSDPFDIRGLATADLRAAGACAPGDLDLAGSVLYAVGCHGGLPVAGSDPFDADRSLDLPQTFLGRGAVAYVANSGYGWGLRHGIGYSERLVQLFTEEMARGGTIGVGEAVRAAKQRYFLEAPRFDPYDEKTLMQWTLFGLPMYAVATGIAPKSRAAAPPDRPPSTTSLGPVTVERRLAAKAALPAYLTRLQLHFDLTAPGVYTKYDAAGEVLPDEPGCPAADGCYYTLNGLVERGTGITDHPIQPYFIYDSRLAGTSQHGVLWMGGSYDEESGWVPVFAELASNGGDGSDHGVAPRHYRNKPSGPRLVPGEDPPGCRPGDLEVNSLVVTTGEAVRPPGSAAGYTLERRYREADLEILYFNNSADSSQNCDRVGPTFLPGPFGGDFHQADATTVAWAVPATDDAGVWRVVVVYSDGSVDGEGRGLWLPLELSDDAGTWRGSVDVAGAELLTYLVQAVDRRGNVSWKEYVTTELPASGVPLALPDPVDVEISSLPPPPPPPPPPSENLLANPDFDEDLAGWLLTGAPPAAITFSPDDVDGLGSSGSALVNGLAGGDTAALSQCVPGNAGGRLSFGGAALIDSARSDSPLVFVLAEAFASGNCTGEPIAEMTTPPLAGDSGGLWRPLPGGTLAVPAAAGSVLVSYVVKAGPASGFDVFIDGLYISPSSIFADGFESGDVSRWSGAVP